MTGFMLCLGELLGHKKYTQGVVDLALNIAYGVCLFFYFMLFLHLLTCVHIIWATSPK
jgi:hypothetical protein